MMVVDVLLRNVRDREVWLEDDGSSVLTVSEVFGVSDPIADVTVECEQAEAAGLIIRPTLDQLWSLTDAGRAWLAAGTHVPNTITLRLIEPDGLELKPFN